jgi:hypothetical protein
MAFTEQLNYEISADFNQLQSQLNQLNQNVRSTLATGGQGYLGNILQTQQQALALNTFGQAGGGMTPQAAMAQQAYMQTVSQMSMGGNILNASMVSPYGTPYMSPGAARGIMPYQANSGTNQSR